MANILISKDGKQLGPYTMEAARSLVLAGTVKATDWAWTEGATDWVPLNQLPGFSDVPTEKPAAQKQTVSGGAFNFQQSRAAQTKTQTADPSQEQALWSGSPSQVLNLAFYIKCAAALFAIWFVAYSHTVSSLLKSEQISVPDFVPPLLFFGSLFLCVIAGAWRCIQLLSTRYVVTTQRVKILRGFLSKDIQEIELFRVKDTAAQQTFFLRMFGIGNIRILSGDAKTPNLVLLAIPKPFELRERLRSEVMVLRQRFNVRELDIM